MGSIPITRLSESIVRKKTGCFVSLFFCFENVTLQRPTKRIEVKGMDARQITIRALKYGNVPHYEWNTTLLELTDSHIFVLGERGRKLTHHTKGKEFIVEHRTIEFFSFDSWFTVSADMADGGDPAVLLQY
ncbi:hypothetical protein LJK87_48015 [Paenibacillus sp. P25]|nr:hypothetical protein LJK87_48015 [Paenibacillus sp. P25]